MANVTLPSTQTHAASNNAFITDSDNLLSSNSSNFLSTGASNYPQTEIRSNLDDPEYTIRFVTPTTSGWQTPAGEQQQQQQQQQLGSASGGARLPSSVAEFDSFSKLPSNSSEPNSNSPNKQGFQSYKKKQEPLDNHRTKNSESHSSWEYKPRSAVANDVLISGNEQDDVTFSFDMTNNDRETLPLLRTASDRDREKQRSGSNSERERLTGSPRDTDRDARKRPKRSRRRTSTECSTDGEMSGSAWGNHFADDPAFASIVKHAEQAILSSAYQPERIYQGSSGSYFVRDSTGTRVAVFKPKDEEPYGNLNPKFTKWMHKVCCPCCFGRSCLVPNQGYLSEAGAYLIDQQLQLNVVPPTRIVRLASDSFNYDAIAREKLRIKQQLSNRFPELGRHFHRVALPPKVGSFQLFVSDYRDADYWLRRFDTEPRLLEGATRREFLAQFQRLVVLDYIIRNTDRGNDNWLIRYDVPTKQNGESDTSRQRSPLLGVGSVSRSRSTDALSEARRNASPQRNAAALGDHSRSATSVRSNEALNSHAQTGDLLRLNSPPHSADRLEKPAGQLNGALASLVGIGGEIGAAPDTRPVSVSPKSVATDDIDIGDMDGDFEYVERARVRIAAIDNGLAFPFKHPDEVRSYPFAWSWLSIAKEPFLDDVCESVLPRLEQPSVDELCARLRTLFRTDRGFDAQTFERQLDVMRGQILNLRRALRERYSPAQLVAMTAVLVHTDGTDTRQSFRKRNPFFSCW